MEKIERQIIELVAADRLYIPVSSMRGKLESRRKRMAREISMPESGAYQGERVYAEVRTGDTTMKARTISEAIGQFAEKYPRHGKILKGMIEEERAAKETNLYFGVNSGCRLTADDYLDVMRDLGFGEASARSLYQELIEVSRNLARKRQEERSILIG